MLARIHTHPIQHLVKNHVMQIPCLQHRQSQRSLGGILGSAEGSRRSQNRLLVVRFELLPSLHDRQGNPERTHTNLLVLY